MEETSLTQSLIAVISLQLPLFPAHTRQKSHLQNTSTLLLQDHEGPEYMVGPPDDTTYLLRLFVAHPSGQINSGSCIQVNEVLMGTEHDSIETIQDLKGAICMLLLDGVDSHTKVTMPDPNTRRLHVYFPVSYQSEVVRGDRKYERTQQNCR